MLQSMLTEAQPNCCVMKNRSWPRSGWRSPISMCRAKRWTLCSRRSCSWMSCSCWSSSANSTQASRRSSTRCWAKGAGRRRDADHLSVTLVKWGEQIAEQVVDQDLALYTHPLPLLRELNIVDTPGTNAVIRRHERLTGEFVPRSDLVLFVTSADRR